MVSVCRVSGGLVLNYWLSLSGGGGRERTKERGGEKREREDKTAAYSTAALLLA